MLPMDLEQKIPIHGGRYRRAADAFALRFRYPVPAFLRNAPGEILVDVQRLPNGRRKA